MFYFGTYLLWALAACSLWHGSLTDDLHTGYVCLLDDTDPSQRESFCLTELRSLLDQVVKGQNQVNTRDGRLEAKLEAQQQQLQEMQTKLNKIENQLSTLLNKIDAPQKAGQEMVEPQRNFKQQYPYFHPNSSSSSLYEQLLSSSKVNRSPVATTTHSSASNTKK